MRHPSILLPTALALAWAFSATASPDPDPLDALGWLAGCREGTGGGGESGKLISRFTSIWRQEAPGRWRIVFDNGEPVCGE
jgi:hypothetical protein